MTTATAPTPSPGTLREEDLQVGRHFVHPETRLEYEDFHAFLCGKDPIPHWRNARIKEISEKRRRCVGGCGGETYQQYVDRLADWYTARYDRDGKYRTAARADTGARIYFGAPA